MTRSLTSLRLLEQARLDHGLLGTARPVRFDPVCTPARPAAMAAPIRAPPAAVPAIGHRLDELGADVMQPDALVGGVPGGQRPLADQPLQQLPTLLVAVVVHAAG